MAQLCLEKNKGQAMLLEQAYIQLCKYIPSGLIFRNELMKEHTSFRIGGPADLFLLPSKLEHIKTAIDICEKCKLPFYIIGKGSNLLVRDEGFRGLIIKISDNFGSFIINENKIWTQAGALLSEVSKKAVENGLTGLEFAVGIPGTIGGAIMMNAGAYNGEIGIYVDSALVMDVSGNIRSLSRNELAFKYRTSILKEEKLILLEANFELEFGDISTSKDILEKYTNLRQLKQPLDLPSAGSVFQRPPGYYAGQLIEEAGFKGFRVGDAQVSEKHCGFIVNLGNAKASDVLTLVEIIRDGVNKNSGVNLVHEIVIIGE